jgi:hypothetical protein
MQTSRRPSVPTLAAACGLAAVFFCPRSSHHSSAPAPSAISQADSPFPLEIEWRSATRAENNSLLAQGEILNGIMRNAEFDSFRKHQREDMQHLSQYRAGHVLSLINQNKESAAGLVQLRDYLEKQLPAPTKSDVLEQAREDFAYIMRSEAIRKHLAALYGVKELDCSEYSSALCASIAARVGKIPGAKDLVGVFLVGGAYFPPEKNGAAILHQWIELNGKVYDPSVRPDLVIQVRETPALHYVPLMKRSMWFGPQMNHISDEVWLHYLP